MKKIKIYLSTLLVLSILLCNISVFTVNAASQTDDDDITIEFEEDVYAEDELQPAAAAYCAPTYGQGGYTVVEGEIPDTSGHNQYGPCTYTIYYYADGSSYGIYKYRHGTNHVQMYSNGSIYNSWWA